MPEILRIVSRCSGRVRGDLAKQVPAALFRHPTVALFVGMCLRCFPADDIVFYLPQLVQVRDASSVCPRYRRSSARLAVAALTVSCHRLGVGVAAGARARRFARTRTA